MVLRVPPYAGECRFVRVTSVLILARASGLCSSCVGAKAPDRTAEGISGPQPVRAEDLRKEHTWQAGAPGLLSRDRLVPTRWRLSVATWRTDGPVDARPRGHPGSTTVRARRGPPSPQRPRRR